MICCRINSSNWGCYLYSFKNNTSLNSRKENRKTDKKHPPEPKQHQKYLSGDNVRSVLWSANNTTYAGSKKRPSYSTLYLLTIPNSDPLKLTQNSLTLECDFTHTQQNNRHRTRRRLKILGSRQGGKTWGPQAN